MLLFLSSVQTTGQGDPVALAMVLVLAVVVAVMALRKKNAKKAEKTQVVVAPQPEPQPQQPKPEAPGSAGQVKIYNVEPKTAAMLMAIVADKMGKPLNELRFISIQEVTKP